MKKRSLSQQWNGLNGFWKFVYSIVFLCMPWSILFILAGIWNLDDRIQEVEDSVKNNTISGEY